MKEFKTFAPDQVEIKIDRQKRTFEGYASVFDVVDSYGDIIKHGAFADTLKSPKRSIKAMWMHEHPIGLPTKMFEDARGLYFEGKVVNHPDFDQYLVLMDEGVVDALSIGFTAKAWSYLDKEEVEQDTSHLKAWMDVRELTKVDLWEVSGVTWGANPEARIEHVTKSVGEANSLAVRLGRGETLSDFEMKNLIHLVDYLQKYIADVDKESNMVQNESENETSVSTDRKSETKDSRVELRALLNSFDAKIQRVKDGL